MAALRVFLPLAICLLLGHQTFAINNAPCQNRNNNGFNTFKYNHILSQPLPKNLKHDVWERYIKKENNCARKMQSFLGLDELDRVKAVCTEEGGKMHKGDLCISIQRFPFVTVIIKEGTCIIDNVFRENKHLILACDIVDNQCLPVHFHGNHKNIIPGNNAKSCQAP